MIRLTLYDTPRGVISMPCRDREEAELVRDVVHELYGLERRDTSFRWGILEQDGLSPDASPWRMRRGTQIDGVTTGGRP
jgi:hypothetical protein